MKTGTHTQVPVPSMTMCPHDYGKNQWLRVGDYTTTLNKDFSRGQSRR